MGIIELHNLFYKLPSLSKPEGRGSSSGWEDDVKTLSTGREGHSDHPSMAAHRTHSHPEDKKNLVIPWHQTPSAVFLAVPGGGTFLRENGSTITKYSLVGQPGFAAPQKMKYKQGFRFQENTQVFVFHFVFNSH